MKKTFISTNNVDHLSKIEIENDTMNLIRSRAMLHDMFDTVSMTMNEVYGGKSETALEGYKLAHQQLDKEIMTLIANCMSDNLVDSEFQAL